MCGPILSSASLLAMHAPDGLFSLSVNVEFVLITLAVLAAACRALSRRSDHRLMPLMGILAAFIFAQMVNFPIASGTTGHFLGGTLAAILVGPWAGTVVMSAVILLQALLGDGGITAFGPNVFNMGLVGTCLAYFIYRAFVGRAFGRAPRVVAASCFAAWVSVPLASVFASLQLAASGTASLGRVLPPMVFTHMVIGIGEALITAAVVAFVIKTRPDLLYGRPCAEERPVGRPVLLFGLAVALVIATCLSLLPHLWDHPDGLESVGFDKGFLAEEAQTDGNGALFSLPAYALGVRLATIDGHVVAVHRYDERDTLIRPGDVVLRIDGQATPDLASAARALHIEDTEPAIKLAPGDPIEVVLERGGREIPLHMCAGAAPTAALAPPYVALLKDYAIPHLTAVWSTSIAGALGTLIVFGMAQVLGRVLMRPAGSAPREGV